MSNQLLDSKDCNTMHPDAVSEKPSDAEYKFILGPGLRQSPDTSFFESLEVPQKMALVRSKTLHVAADRDCPASGYLDRNNCSP